MKQSDLTDLKIKLRQFAEERDWDQLMCMDARMSQEAGSRERPIVIIKSEWN
jgi:hypothetical protein